MNLTAVAAVACLLAGVPALLYAINSRLFRSPPRRVAATPRVSVLIPAPMKSGQSLPHSTRF